MNAPADFPRQGHLASLGGAQPKLSVRLIDGVYVGGLTPEEVEVRYDICADLVNQLVAYTRKKHQKSPDEPIVELLQRVSSSFRQKGWDLSSAEIDWCMKKVGEAFR